MNANHISYGEKVKLDKNDKKILEFLHKDARMPISDISRKTGIQRDSVMYRIKRMENLKVIRFYTAVLNPSLMGYPIYSYVRFEFQNFNEKTEKEFLGFTTAHSQITYVAKLSGKYDFEIVICAKNLEEFDKVLREIRSKFSKIIKEYSSSMILQEYKFDNLVELIEEKTKK